MKNNLLLIPNKPDIERDALAKVWQEKGGSLKRIGKFWVKPETGTKQVAIYGYDTFCLVLAQILGIELLMPKDEMIAQLSYPFLKRKIEVTSIEEVEQIEFPTFIKPITPKLFNAQVFQDLEEFYEKTKGIALKEQLLVSEIIEVEKEVRSFILNNEICDAAFYEGEGNLKEAKRFIEAFLLKNTLELPQTYVLDIGYNSIDGWFVVEFNASWGAGLNNCRPEKIITCIKAAAVN